MRDLMKMILVFLVVLLLSSCGKEYAQDYAKAPVETCSAVRLTIGSLITCPDGSATFIADGSKGDTGNRGATGQQGAPGMPGSPGTVVTPIQLCPNVTPTYATVFPEVALCLGGNLYGTFNNNTSYQYLAELPDGAYSSNGQGAACSFTITGCVVSY